MTPLTAMLICAAIYAFGDYVSHKTKALLPMLFVSGAVLLLGFWTVIPLTLLEDSKVMDIGKTFAPIFVVYIGTLLDIRQMKQELKTVLISLAAVIAIAAMLYLIAAPLIGEHYALSAAGPITGGLVATLVVQQAATEMGLETIVLFVTMIFILQYFIGLPIASYCLTQESKSILRQFRSQEDALLNTSARDNKPVTTDTPPAWRFIPPLPDKLKTPFILLMKAMLVTWLAVQFSTLIEGAINIFIIALIFGVIFKEIGFLEEKILDQAGASGLALFTLFALIYWSLPKATPDILIILAIPVVVTFIVSVIAVFIVSYFLAKLFKYSWHLTTAIAISCMIGFPGTYLIPEEIAKSHGKTTQEQQFLLDQFLPKMLVAGFVTVSVASVFVAGIMIKFF